MAFTEFTKGHLDSAMTSKEAADEIEAAIDAAATSSTSAVALAADLASTQNGEGAALVGIEDAGTLYTATTVEGALAEVKAIADEVEGRVAANVAAIDTPSGDAEEKVNAILSALVAAGLMDPETP